MNRVTASVTALGACAVGAAMLLAQSVRPPARTSPGAELLADSSAALARTQRTLAQVLPPHDAPATSAPVADADADANANANADAALALCATCAASHQLVRVLRRRQHQGMHPLRTIILVDRSWPALDSLVRQMTGSRLVVDATLNASIAVTPAALVVDARGTVQPRPSALVIGTPAVAARLTPTATPP